MDSRETCGHVLHADGESAIGKEDVKAFGATEGGKPAEKKSSFSLLPRWTEVHSAEVPSRKSSVVKKWVTVWRDRS